MRGFPAFTALYTAAHASCSAIFHVPKPTYVVSHVPQKKQKFLENTGFILRTFGIIFPLSNFTHLSGTNLDILNKQVSN